MAGRTWVAVILCFFVWFGYLKWFAPQPPPKKPGAVSENTSPTSTSPSMGSATSSFLEGPKAEAFKGTQDVKSVTVETQTMTATLSSLGGKPSSITLKGFHDTVDPESPAVSVLSPEKTPFSLATVFSDSRLADLTNGTYQITENRSSVVMTRKAKSGATFRKEYRFSEEGELAQLDFLLKVPANQGATDWGTLTIPLGGTGLTYELQEPLKAWEAVSYQSETITRKPISDLEKTEEVLQGRTNWLSFGNRYFTTALVNKSGVNPDVVFVGRDDFKGGYLRYPLRTKSGQNELSFSLQLYAGPKDLNKLSQVSGLDKLVDYGFFSILAFPLLALLKFFYGLIPNYGVAIILLTLLVRGLFYPLTQKSMKSMKSMQKLQPQIQALKEKYKDDREKLNREQMALFKTHKINPAAGCLPILIQLPVFIALYQVLANSMELFHSPFFGWINDLSAKDPYYIYPILMGISMFLQQKLTPTAGMEPMQQKMMMFMPLIFTFFMVNLPSGLTLYIFVSTILGIAQQFFTTRDSKPAAAAVAKASSSPGKS